jgi:adenine phosphoribosyltransferase
MIQTGRDPMHDDLKAYVRAIPDFPKEGVLFRDITPILLDARAFKRVSDILLERYRDRAVDKIAAIESRGFIFGSALALGLDVGLVPLRKPGKLPWRTIAETYSLEYGEAALEMHIDAVDRGERVVIVDDLLATGGTAAAAARLIERRGGVVEEIAFVIELAELHGVDKLGGHSVYTLISY